MFLRVAFHNFCVLYTLTYFIHIYVLHTYIYVSATVCEMYLEQQKVWAAGLTVGNLPMGFCKGNNDRRQQGIYRDYIDLSAVIEESGISEHHATTFITTVKTITHRHGTDIPIPSEYRNLKRAILQHVECRLLPIKCELIPYPRSMFDCSDVMKSMALVHVELMLVVADIMRHVAKTGFYVFLHVYMYIVYVYMCYIRIYVFRNRFKH